MATKTIGQLTQATTINNADEFAIEQSGVTKRVAASVVRGDIIDANIKSDAAIAYSKLAALNSAQILVGNGSNVATAVSVTGDVTISNAGVTAIAAGAVAGSKLADGMVVQVVQATTTTVTTISSATASHEIPADNTKPQNTEGVEIVTQAITPVSNTNKVLVRAVVPFALEGSNTPVIALFRGTGADAIATSYISTVSAFNGMLVIEYLDSPATASSVTYRVRVGRGSSGTFYVNGASGGAARFNGTQFSTLTLTEIKAS